MATHSDAPALPATSEVPSAVVEEGQDAKRLKSLDTRFQEAHRWVLQHHAETFRKLAEHDASKP